MLRFLSGYGDTGLLQKQLFTVHKRDEYDLFNSTVDES